MQRRNGLFIMAIAFTVVEVAGIVLVTRWIGGMGTWLAILLTAVLGAYLAQAEGRKVLAEARRQMQAGQIPGRMMLDGLCVFAGGIMLAMPGFISDIAGLTLLLPPTRAFYRQMMLRWLEKRMKNGSFTIRRY
ncbi:FxsA family protein [Paenibacillus thailandensis]|uniref:FxsA family protein n=1 Tax=Paenibacillus thailandensis TaxID=393250 RepID=A0ABW5QRB7_9BACL